MSYWLYKKKRNIRVGDKILALMLYGDSSVRDFRGRIPYHWAIRNISDDPGLLIKKSVLEEARQKELLKEFENLNEFRKNSPDYPDKTPITMDSYCYAGNSYPGGRKVKNMHAFNSIRKTVSLEDVIRENHGGFGIEFNYYNVKTYKDTGEKFSFPIREEKDLIKADVKYREFHKNTPEGCGVVLGVSGLYIR